MKGNLIETKMMLSLPDVSDLNRNCLFFMIKVLTYIVGLNSVLKFKVKDQIEKLNDWIRVKVEIFIEIIVIANFSNCSF